MPQAARPLPSDREELSPREGLRVVPPDRPRRRRPSRAVIRRRRAIAVGGLAGLIGLPLAIVAIGGSAPSETGRISALLTRGASEPQTLCDHLSTAMLQAVGGHGVCLAASPQRGPAGEVHDVRITGTTATAVVSRPDGDERYSLVQQDGDWKVDEVS